jgi:hypothetical protein
VDLTDRRGGERLGLEAIERAIRRGTELGFDHLGDPRGFHRPRRRLQPGQDAARLRRQRRIEVAHHLADLHRQALEPVELVEQLARRRLGIILVDAVVDLLRAAVRARHPVTDLRHQARGHPRPLAKPARQLAQRPVVVAVFAHRP